VDLAVEAEVGAAAEVEAEVGAAEGRDSTSSKRKLSMNLQLLRNEVGFNDLLNLDLIR
jgi:hypothetical protein